MPATAVQAKERPLTVTAGAIQIMLLGVALAGSVVFRVARNLTGEDWEPAARGMFIALNLVVLAFAVFVVVVGFLVLRGRQWAWILSLILLPIAILLVGVLIAAWAAMGGTFWTFIGVGIVCVDALLILTVPRSARDYFRHVPVPPPAYPWAPGFQQYPPV